MSVSGLLQTALLLHGQLPNKFQWLYKLLYLGQVMKGYFLSSLKMKKCWEYSFKEIIMGLLLVMVVLA